MKQLRIKIEIEYSEGQAVSEAAYRTDDHKVAIQGPLYPQDLAFVSFLVEAVKDYTKYGMKGIFTTQAQAIPEDEPDVPNRGPLFRRMIARQE